ncbi:MAG: adenylate/guanylate cyclase domain-containing protein [Jatrophihabitans sp.]|uniref:adenylate/guanylate cyclase domain-containing protein n=1 Tax=Jatrophihabitans sp. TaxID=1932789 RepID=UPI00390EA7B7
MDAPEARYIERDGALLAFQLVGDGPADVLWVGEIAQHFDLSWTDPELHEMYERAATYSRTTYMQLRGAGPSDPITYWPTLEQQADDVLAVLDAAEMQRATLVGSLTTCGAVVLAAARAPERVSGLVLLRALACGPLTPGAEQCGWTAADAAGYAAGWRRVVERWGSGETIEMWDSSLATGYNRRLMALLERCSAKPAFARMYVEAALRLDMRPYVASVQAPTRVLYTPTAHEPVAAVRYAAELIPNATFHELPPTPPGASIAEAYVDVWDHVKEAATGERFQPDADQFLGTVLFTDVVNSTPLLARIGDAAYRELRGSHERQVRLRVDEHGGRVANVIGDGTLSVFDGPAKAVRCADRIRTDAEGLGIEVRAGLHTGELVRTGRDVTGLGVHIGARICALAGPGEVLVSGTVSDLVAGSGLEFADRGRHALKGVPGRWTLSALVGTAAQVGLPVERSLETALDRAALRTARTAPRVARAALRVGNAVQRYRARAGQADSRP